MNIIVEIIELSNGAIDLPYFVQATRDIDLVCFISSDTLKYKEY